MLCAFSIALFPILLRMHYGLDVFGETFFENVIFAGCFIGFISGFGIMSFGFICAFDFKRRFNAMKRLGELIHFPGIPLSDFLFHMPKKEIKNSGDQPDENISADIDNGELGEPQKTPYVFIDLKKRSNVFAWMNCRKTLRSFGEGFYLRIQGYTSILLMYSFFCVAILNVIAWMQMRHHVSTIYLIMMIVIIIASISIFSISKATKLQHLSSSQRDLIRKEIFLQEEEIGHSESEDNSDKELRQLRSAKALLEQVDESINFNDLIKGGNIPKEYIPGVEKGINDIAESGALIGFPIIDFSVTLYDGAYHDVDSSVLAFEIAGRGAMREAASKAGIKLLEPIMDVEVVTPEDHMGDVIGDISSRRGQIAGSETRGPNTVISAKVPLANMFGYVNQLRSFTKGRATYSMQFDHYAEVPQAVAEEVKEKFA